mmetsp:Transcript_13771/g.38823  ORF Transcript_13771/g.38823 Transcript_13771/m.38823 type:complete len:225 (+) Transcript_13771:606-1280(+)
MPQASQQADSSSFGWPSKTLDCAKNASTDPSGTCDTRLARANATARAVTSLEVGTGAPRAPCSATATAASFRANAPVAGHWAGSADLRSIRWTSRVCALLCIATWRAVIIRASLSSSSEDTRPQTSIRHLRCCSVNDAADVHSICCIAALTISVGAFGLSTRILSSKELAPLPSSWELAKWPTLSARRLISKSALVVRLNEREIHLSTASASSGSRIICAVRSI